MSYRESIRKSVRFEVFKRDNFTCQYCGAKAPDVVLHVDHINPVSKGGDNEIINLVTACLPCNLGKSDRLLSDTSMLDRPAGPVGRPERAPRAAGNDAGLAR
ncbi:HNH endonuclease [Pseudomonas aeruginosa]